MGLLAALMLVLLGMQHIALGLVLGLVKQGQTNREIARNLTVSVSTVKIHVEYILSKLDVSDRTQAAVRAIELGLLHTTSIE
jgi:ATP/maltotriose-dependent transcriptional regulator MalT